MNTVSIELLDTKKSSKDKKQDTIVLLFDYKYMINYQKTLKKIISNSDIENRIQRKLQKYPMSLIKQFKSKLTAEEYLICHYKLCYQITGSLKVLFDWFINDMPMPVETVVEILNRMNIPRTIQYRNIPSILVQIKNE